VSRFYSADHPSLWASAMSAGLHRVAHEPIFLFPSSRAQAHRLASPSRPASERSSSLRLSRPASVFSSASVPAARLCCFLVTGLSVVHYPRRLLCRSLFFVRWERPVGPELPVSVASVFRLRVEDTGSISFGCDSSVLLGTLIRWSGLRSSQ
jgi:hypothetical protein